MTRLTEIEYTALLHANPDIHADEPRQLGKVRKVAGPSPTEAQEQAAIMQWAEMMRPQLPDLEWLFHVPNGGARDPITARMLQGQGVKAGVPDLCLPVPSGRYHGLYIELKRADHSNAPTIEQKRWIDHLSAVGYLVAICYGAEQAIKTIRHYLEAGHHD